MGTYVEAIGPGTIRLERELPGPIETVWAHLTESDKRGTWFASGLMDLRVGAAVPLHFDHNSLTPHREPIPETHQHAAGGIEMTVYLTDCDPPRLLGWNMDSTAATSDETFELDTKGDRVRLIITHRNLPDRPMMVGVSAAWHIHVDVLEAVLAGEVPPPFWSGLERYTAEYEERIAKA
jgi:uncharacterized protein YndB with AHSA1/START domain